MTERSRKVLPLWTGWLGAGLAVAALAAYLATLSPGFFPGASASYLAKHLGTDPFPSLTNPLWGWVIRVVDALGGGAPFAVNAFSALCAAGAVWLLFGIVLRIQPPGRRGEPTPPEATPPAVLGAVAAALFFAASPTLWMVGTRAHPLSFDIFLLLLAVRLLSQFLASNHIGWLYASAFLSGIVVVEYISMAPLVPLLAIVSLLGLYRRGMFAAGVVFRMALFAAAGLLLYIPAAWQYVDHPSMAWREIEGLPSVVWETWREQYGMLKFSLPKVGWLTTGLVTVLPFVIAFAYRMTPRGGRPALKLPSVVLLLVITGVLGAVVYDFPLSPWNITRGVPIVVVPYAIAAVGFGLALAHFAEYAKSGGLRTVGQRILLVLVVLVIGFAAWRNLPLTSGSGGAAPIRYADAMLQSLEGREWIVTGGEVDETLALAARHRGQRLRVLNPRYGLIGSHRRYLASLFEDTRMQSLALTGFQPLIQEWISRPDGARSLALALAPDWWLAVGLDAVPNRVLYLGAASADAPAPAEVFARFRDFWSGYAPVLRDALANERSPAHPWAVAIRGHLTRLANNLGVFAEDHDALDVADEAYRAALDVDDANLSARINRHALARRMKRPDTEALEKELAAAVETQVGKFSLWSLGAIYGIVRTPEVYAGRGWTWAMSGKAGQAIREVQRAVRAGADVPSLRLMLGSLHLQRDEIAQSEQEFEAVLAKDPRNAAALLGLARVAVARGKEDEARARLMLLRDVGANDAALKLEEAVLEASLDNAPRALALLVEVTQARPEDLRAWAALAVIAAQLGDENRLAEATRKLETAKNLPANFRIALARIAASRGNIGEARRQTEQALRTQPANEEALDLLLRIAMNTGERDLAQALIERLLAVNSRHALANHLLGAFQYAREEYALAESSFRASLASERNAKVLNDLAFVLVRRGAIDEAEPLVRESLQKDTNNGSSWDTLANILLARGDLRGADEAVQRAIGLKPNSAGILWTLVRVHAKQGRVEEALKAAEDLMARPTDLGSEDYAALRDLVKSLRNP